MKTLSGQLSLRIIPYKLVYQDYYGKNVLNSNNAKIVCLIFNETYLRFLCSIMIFVINLLKLKF